MATRVLAIAIDCLDAERLAGFWCAALGAEVRERWRDACEVEYVEVGAPAGPTLLFQPVPEAKSSKNRLHLDLAPEPGDQREEVRRLVVLGARVLSEAPGHPWIVLADPEDNEFCVLPAR
ncbi:hypothetical protein CFN78_14250 [Amycolatopsis antarctica]|uniref:Glyoxalase-like domain-containing protein n=1 Tax=Amycolatopsis antarctica TaxID=1854586 RepID=A0A263D2S7_9PSEU|nr:VOC family protein [Amycolatopsis antarctica]OZM72772.1 hypothetical protein CFN78_14250 [Amycolatopsis antarctica]